MLIPNKSKIVRYLYIIITTLLSGHAAQTIFPFFTYLPLVSGTVSLMILLFAKRIIGKADTYFLLILAIMIACTVSTQLFHGFKSYINFACFIITAYAMVQLWSFDTVAHCYRTIMSITTTIAIAGHLLLQNTTILNILPIYENINKVKYGFSYIFSYIVDFPDRNCGMFWEPGLFATHLTFATIIEILFVKRTDWKHLVLYIVGFYTANSSAGFVLCFLCILLLLVRNTKTANLSWMRSIFNVIVVIAAIILIFNFDTILSNTALSDNEYFQKLKTDSVMDSSRAAAFAHNLLVWRQNPLFGTGFVSALQLATRFSDTSTSTYLLSVFGILGLSYTIAWIYGVFKIKNTNILSKIILSALFLIIINKEPHHNLLFTWCLLFYLVEGNLKKQSNDYTEAKS